MLIDKNPVPILQNIGSLARRYDAWLCDIWGVIHNGVSYFADAIDACQKFRASGGTVILMTNAPRPAHFVADQLAAMRIPRDCYDDIVSSGDVTRSLLEQRAGQAVYHIGPERDAPMLDGLDLSRAELDEADFILNSGPFHDETETPKDYEDLLSELAARRLPMICANPDLMVERGGKLVYCAGALAELYSQLGGQVIYAGKPYGPIYERAAIIIGEQRGNIPDKTKILAIGDGVKTDIKGAADFGIDSVFIASAVHVETSGNGLEPDALAPLFSGNSSRPVAALEKLRW